MSEQLRQPVDPMPVEQTDPEARNGASHPAWQLVMATVVSQVSDDAAEEDIDQCALALSSVHAFLHGEIPEMAADQIRAHLMVCERCTDDFDVEAMLSTVLRRCHPPASATETLRTRVQHLHIRLEELGFEG